MKYILLFLLIFQSCATARIEDVEFISGKKTMYLPYGSADHQQFSEYFKSLDTRPQSYTASFKMNILSFHPGKRNFTAKGKVYFDAGSGRIRIQLMDKLFGFVFTQIIAGNNGLQIKSAGSKEIHSQPMDDIAINDPSSSSGTIVIPFRIIHEFLTREYFKTGLARGNYYNFREKRVLVQSKNEKLIYLYGEKGLSAIELYSSPKKIRAIATVTGEGDYLPVEITTKVTDLAGSPREKDLIKITLGTVTTGAKLTDKNFEF